jgi:hypothetical protein
MVDVDSGGWLATEDLPGSARTAAARLRQLDADAQRDASRFQRARTRGLVRLDLSHPEELDLLRHYGPFTTDTRVWVHGDPTPVIETADSLGDLLRFTYRLDPPSLNRPGPHSQTPGSPAPHLSRGGSAPASASDPSLRCLKVGSSRC